MTVNGDAGLHLSFDFKRVFLLNFQACWRRCKGQKQKTNNSSTEYLKLLILHLIHFLCWLNVKQLQKWFCSYPGQGENSLSTCFWTMAFCITKITLAAVLVTTFLKPFQIMNIYPEKFCFLAVQDIRLPRVGSTVCARCRISYYCSSMHTAKPVGLHCSWPGLL